MIVHQSLLRKIDGLRAISGELVSRSVLTDYVDDVTVIMSDCSAIEVFGTTCKTECAFTEANMNHGRWWVCSTVHLRGEYMPTDCIVRCWAEGLDSLLGTYFGGDNKLNRNFEKVTNRVANLNQK